MVVSAITFFLISAAGIAIVAVINMAFGMIWYAPWLFGRAWTEKRVSRTLTKKESSAYLATFGAAFVFAWLLDAILRAGYFGVAGFVTSADIITLGLLVWLGSVSATLIGGMIWKHRSLQWWTIVAGYSIASIFLQIWILSQLG